MARRHHAREAVIGFLYAYGVGNKSIDKFIIDILEDRKIRHKQKDFALELFNGIMQNIEEIDKKIIENLKEWSFNRIGDIEKSILRLGVYEILYGKLDTAIIINEAIELSKKLCDTTSGKFINGVLDSIKKSKIK
jgi:N utilization substance protein B